MTPNNSQTALAQVEAFNRRDLDAQVSGYANTFTMSDHAHTPVEGAGEVLDAGMDRRLVRRHRQRG